MELVAVRRHQKMWRLRGNHLCLLQNRPEHTHNNCTKIGSGWVGCFFIGCPPPASAITLDVAIGSSHWFTQTRGQQHWFVSRLVLLRSRLAWRPIRGRRWLRVPRWPARGCEWKCACIRFSKVSVSPVTPLTAASLTFGSDAEKKMYQYIYIEKSIFTLSTLQFSPVVCSFGLKRLM